MPELLTMQDLANGHLDVKALGEAANGDENTIVTTRTGNTYPSAERAINIMFQNGALPATPFATKALMTASALVDGDYAQVTDDTVNNGLYVKTAGAWVKSAYDPSVQAMSSIKDELTTGGLVNARQVFSSLAANIITPINFAELTTAEVMVFDFIKRLEIHGETGNEISFIINYNDYVLTNLSVFSSNEIIPLSISESDNRAQVISDNGKSKVVRFNYYSSVANKSFYGTIEIDYSPKSYSSFNYNVTTANPNLVFDADNVKTTAPFALATQSVKQQGIFNLKADGMGLLLSNSLYMEFTVDEPFILGSVSVDIAKLPSAQPAWVECTIYPLDNGFGTAPRISSTDQVPIYKVGSLRMPFEHKVMQAGRYSIGFKTNATDCLAIKYGGGVYYRGYDEAERPMPITAPRLSHPLTDKTGFFPAFELHKYKQVLQPILPSNWALEYRSDYTFLCGNGNDMYYMHRTGNYGERVIWFGRSMDGGLTINKIGGNLPDDIESQTYLENVSHGAVRWEGDTLILYTTAQGSVAKITVPPTGAVTIADISPPLRSETGLDSYAPLVIFKGYLWWGEYGNPSAPKIHKMNISTGVWSTSIEKPTSGATGARHVHFLYPSPIDPNVLWAVWGDASNGGGQGINKLTITAATASAGLDTWVQWSTGRHDDVGTTLPYPTSIIEIFEGENGLVEGGDNTVLIGSGDQPPTHLVAISTKEDIAGKALVRPLTFKRESAPSTETCHWLAIDDEKTIYYFVAESLNNMSLYASPYPYSETFQISKYWQQATAGNIYYANGYVQTKYHRFAKIKFKNVLDNRDISKTPFVANATSEADVVVKFNDLLTKLQGSGVLQITSEQGNDKSSSSWVDPTAIWENWGQ